MKRLATTARMLILAGSTAVGGAANAAALFSFLEDGTGVTGTLSGSLDLTGAISDGDLTLLGPAGINPGFGGLLSGPEDQVWTSHFMLGTDRTWGADVGTLASGWTGTPFGVFANIPQSGIFVVTPKGYAGETLSGTLSFAGATLASLGITPGSHSYNLPNDSVTISFSQVPLPATLPLLVAAIVLAGFAVHRRPA